MPDEDKNFGGSLVLDVRKWWRYVKTIFLPCSCWWRSGKISDMQLCYTWFVIKNVISEYSRNSTDSLSLSLSLSLQRSIVLVLAYSTYIHSYFKSLSNENGHSNSSQLPKYDRNVHSLSIYARARKSTRVRGVGFASETSKTKERP